MQHETQTMLQTLTYLDQNGYLRFKNSHILFHRWAAEKKYGRKINPDECVHHLDGDKTNNNSYNLIICTKEKHKLIHEKNTIFAGSWKFPEFIFPCTV